MFDETISMIFENCTNPVEYITAFLFMYMLFDAVFGLIGSLVTAFGAGKR